MLVKAKVNVRHNGEDYEVGEELTINKKHLNEDIFEVLEEGEEGFSMENNKDELIAELDRLGVDYDPKAKKEILLSLIEENAE